MYARELISDDIPPLKTSDTGDRALEWMNEFRVSHLPIVNNIDFLGLISEADILDFNSAKEAIGAHRLNLSRPFVYDYQHTYDVLKVMSSLKLTVIPVLNDKEQYLGLIHLSSLLQHFAEMASMKESGGLLVLELNLHDYSLSEISRIVESNDAKILSLYVSSSVDSTLLELTIKINRTDLSAIIQTFNRFNYTIKASFHQSEYVDDLKDRFASFMKYINI
ncbi:MAG: CBS domain-containing protein [Bacteroidia bacterium]|nr:CBS domain-containing protein [Bacteroidia bacterium]MCZ2247724.1 CBS domain-containing protein [Bacteroidia bacterium]